MILALAAEKGGGGKTTLAATLVVWRAMQVCAADCARGRVLRLSQV